MKYLPKLLVISVPFFIAFLVGFISINSLSPNKVVQVSGTIAEKGKVELINDSSLIIYGHVDEVLPSFWSNPEMIKGADVRNIIQTDILVNVREAYKGTPYSNQIKVRINKGQVGDTLVLSEGYPDFTSGEEVVLFLSEDDGDLAEPDENYYVLTGMVQGKFELSSIIGKQKTFSNKVIEDDGVNVNKEDFSLTTIKTEIESTLKELEENPIPKMTKEEIEENNKKVLGE
ncbi:hypothetical protein [Paenibacillus typhae]|uniref:hypothetical protein n=1 Tax=Paenibacillus typhae TaxID=1174501 RepID=UPI001C8E98F7|nr:hypothetical protein [Paenibacillus typhae]MBY0011224.1 hypothetical protein [Paenibacillus typhae]